MGLAAVTTKGWQNAVSAVLKVAKPRWLPCWWSHVRCWHLPDLSMDVFPCSETCCRTCFLLWELLLWWGGRSCTPFILTLIKVSSNLVTWKGAEVLYNMRTEEAAIWLPFVTAAFRVNSSSRTKFTPSKNNCKKDNTRIFHLNWSEPTNLRKDTTLSQTILFVYQIAYRKD